MILSILYVITNLRNAHSFSLGLFLGSHNVSFEWKFANFIELDKYSSADLCLALIAFHTIFYVNLQKRSSFYAVVEFLSGWHGRAIINVSARTNGSEKGQAAAAVAFVEFQRKKSQMRLPIIICNRGRKGESKIGTAVSTTGYTAIVRFLEGVTTLDCASFAQFPCDSTIYDV